MPKTGSGPLKGPVCGEEKDTQFMHAVYLPSDISDKKKNGRGRPNGPVLQQTRRRRRPTLTSAHDSAMTAANRTVGML